MKTEIHRLMCQLTDDEQRTRGIELAAATALLNDLTEQKKSIAGKIADTTATINQLAETVKHKQEERPVVCVMDPDYKDDTMTIRRTDNGMIVAVRQLTHAERQPDLPMEGGVQCK
jgi:adenine-specific DNA methylase